MDGDGSVQFWTSLTGVGAGRRAAFAEQEGWDGIAFGDSQCLNTDPFVELGIAASVTKSALLATNVVNPLTRIPAVLANAISTVQAESDGRAILGIGRGDSSLAHMGLGPVRLEAFERCLRRIQGYLRGEEVPFDRDFDAHGAAPDVATLGMLDAPTSSKLHWRDPTSPKVPVEVVASGAKVIELAAVNGDGVTLAVGLSPDRLRWAIDHARTTRRAHGLTPDIPFGTYVPVLVHSSQSTARDLVSGLATSVARFSVMHGRVAAPIRQDQERVLLAVHSSYDMSQHFRYGSPQSKLLDDRMIDSFAIAGPPTYCTERISELLDLGLTKIILKHDVPGVDPEVLKTSHRLLTETVLPALR
jgi:5,10-methylenetetrahydromethanopterin reductase